MHVAVSSSGKTSHLKRSTHTKCNRRFLDEPALETAGPPKISYWATRTSNPLERLPMGPLEHHQPTGTWPPISSADPSPRPINPLPQAKNFQLDFQKLRNFFMLAAPPKLLTKNNLRIGSQTHLLNAHPFPKRMNTVSSRTEKKPLFSKLCQL